ncbi:CBN-SRD-40 protein [Caenorhabditis brenneri]|uniref:CBN-SRD-40 protein n=1 Tax=Caenorhabditis brenneri TaxID=135651 RepID=G0MBH1_CAEBE|nr:CBN-SRD-40 protein [Caenorhabditis brenneri]
MTTDVYRNFLDIFCPVFFILTLLTQAVLIYLIFYHSPKSLQTMKIFLGNTCIFQIILVIVACASQFRMISTSIPIELRSYGPCRYLEAWMGYSLYQMLQTSAFMSGMSILITFFFKYEVVRSIKLPRCRVIGIVLVFHVPIFISLVMEVIMVITQSLPDEVRLHYKLLNSNVEEYSIIGALSLKTLPSIINFGLISGAVVFAPFVCFFFRKNSSL